MYPAIRSSMSANEPDISDARTMLKYSGPNSFECFAIASENCLPLSTSVRSDWITRRNPECEVWSAIPSSAARRLMPARIITASCVVKSSTCFWFGLPEFSSASLPSSEPPEARSPTALTLIALVPQIAAGLRARGQRPRADPSSI